MKKHIILFILMLFTLTSYSQTTREGNTFKQNNVQTNNGQQTKYTYEDKKGVKYPIYITKNGAVYIIKISAKTNKEYKYYLPKDIKETILKELNFKANKDENS